MKLAITLIVIGSLLLLQYVYFALIPPIAWHEGIISALIGVVMLFLGIMRLRRKRHSQSGKE